MVQSGTTQTFGIAGGVGTIFAHATGAALAALSAATIADRGCCLTFHRVATAKDWPDQPNRGFHIDLSYLERLIIHLQATGWEIVTMSEALRRFGQPGAGRFVNFSVDDCYRDTADLLVPLCQRLNVPMTLFVTTGIPDGQFRLREAGLETILQQETACSEADAVFPLGTPKQKRNAFAAITAQWELSSDPDESYTLFCRRHGYDPDVLDDRHRITWSMIETIADDPLIEIGGHTIRHRRISSLPEAEAMGEMAGCRERLETKLGRMIEHFAFPYGRAGDCSVRDFALARQAGFRSASTTRKGLIGQRSDPFQLPRNTLNGNHRRLPFAYAHLTGASGLVARMMRRV